MKASVQDKLPYQQAALGLLRVIQSSGPQILHAFDAATSSACQQCHASNITIRQGLMLLALLRRGERSIKEIAEEICETPPAVSAMIQRLVEKGFVTRVENREDRRRVVVALSEPGADLAGLLESAFVEILGNALVQVSRRRDPETGRLRAMLFADAASEPLKD